MGAGLFETGDRVHIKGLKEVGIFERRGEGMKIYTGYFGGLRHYVGLQSIAISRSVPTGLIGKIPNLRSLNPTRDILNMKDNPEEYTKAYNYLLRLKDSKEILSSIEFLSKGRDVVLLCYERPGDFCHRHLVAKWLGKKFGIEVKEVEK